LARGAGEADEVCGERGAGEEGGGEDELHFGFGCLAVVLEVVDGESMYLRVLRNST
jgi:hypothetical protein